MAPLVHLITGANKGIGYEATRLLAERQRDQAIVLLGTRSMQNGEAAVAKIKQANPSFDYANVQLVQIDVSKKESIQAAADFVKSKYGNVHVLINNVGIDGDAEGAEMCFNVNIFGVYDTLVAFHPLMTFVMALTRKWAADHPEIKTTLVCPGYCATDLTNHAGYLTAAEGGQRILFRIFHPDKAQTGKFYSEGREHPFK
ncbi:unnamed protein product [Aphanomyces euteiches]